MKQVAIIGAGPAGASAALFCAKAGVQTLLIDSDQSMTKRAWIENHYGVPEITGPDLIETGKKQAAKFGAELVQAKASAIVKESEGFRIDTDNGSFEAQYVIVTTGALTDLGESSGLAVKPGTEPRIKQIFDVDSQGRTNVAGVWAAGTAAGASVHTIITAGDGAKVAINVISEIKGSRYVDHDVLKA